MATIDQVNNGDTGLQARTKMNLAIDEANKLEGKTPVNTEDTQVIEGQKSFKGGVILGESNNTQGTVLFRDFRDSSEFKVSFNTERSSGFGYIGNGLYQEEGGTGKLSSTASNIGRSFYRLNANGITLGIAPSQTTPIGDPVTGLVEYELYGSHNSNKSDVDWNADTMTANQYLPFTGCHLAEFNNQDFKPFQLVKIRQKGLEFLDDKQPIWEALYVNPSEKGIFGVVYGLHKIGENRHWMIAAVGDMPMLVCGENGAIEYGDKLTASSTQGIAMKANTDSPICAIAGTDVYFKNDEIIKIGVTKE